MNHIFVDTERLQHNLDRMHTAAAQHGVAVRAHVKGHRTIAIARRQLAAGACGIALTRVDELARYVAAGLADIVLAWPWRDLRRLRVLARLARACRLSVHVDDPQTVRRLDRLRAEGLGVRIVIEDGVDAPSIADAVARSDHLHLDGITGYADYATLAQIRDRDAIARRLAHDLTATAHRLRDAGHPVATVTIGGTPAAHAAMTVPGITELGVGAYALGDAGLARQGICEFSDVAASLRLPEATSTEGLNQPWSAETATLTDGDPIPPGTHPLTVLPAHICPAVLRATALVTTEGEHWPIIKEPP
jgi:D-serine deaminase-like pyridoxal phosphate-dependent protein